MDTNWTNGIIKCKDVELFYTRTGGNKPPIVCAHGYTDDGSCWTDLAKELEKDYDLVMYDARGHGQSSRITVDIDIDMVADMHCVISELGLQKPAIIGHSMGGLVTQLLLDRGYGVAGVALDPGPIAGVIPDLRSLLADPPG